MFDLSSDMFTFYDEHVRLKKPGRDSLAQHRDLNLSRLNAGLDELQAESGEAHPHYDEYRDQGSYRMYTLNRHDDNDYDIDVAVIFEHGEIPAKARAARQRVCDALTRKCTNFSKEPEARTNAVTVWYAEGHHLDFAAYRRRTGDDGVSVVEHASGEEWRPRDPDAIANWFEESVSSKSPEGTVDAIFGVVVPPEQLRRIVSLIKKFCKSRSGWSLPGGMIVSTLVVDAYCRDRARDDVALRDTLVAVRNRLRVSTAVYNPLDPVEELTAKARRKSQVDRLLERLETAVTDLAVLDRADCTRAQARAAWNAVFNSDYWGVEDEEQPARTVNASAVAVASVECALAVRKGGNPYGYHRSGGQPLPRGVHLRFRLTNPNALPPYEVRWTINNTGGEARAKGDLTSSHASTDADYWTSTAYKGRHSMTCEVLRSGVVVARAVHVVRITGSGRRRDD